VEPMEDQQLLATAGNFAIAILLALSVGVEREKRKSEEEDTGHIAGLRTFTLLALLGAVAGWLSREASSPWILAAAVLVVGTLITAGYFVNAKPGPDGKGGDHRGGGANCLSARRHGHVRRPGAGNRPWRPALRSASRSPSPRKRP
jgi:hypothetical protein